VATKLFDMARAPIKESVSPSTVGKETPSPYSYEHKITLNKDDMANLGLNDVKVGDVFHTLAEGHVVSTDQQEGENGKAAHNVHVQLKKMAMKAKKGQGGKSALQTVSDAVDNAPAESTGE
jgi:hypothetical protein